MPCPNWTVIICRQVSLKFTTAPASRRHRTAILARSSDMSSQARFARRYRASPKASTKSARAFTKLPTVFTRSPPTPVQPNRRTSSRISSAITNNRSAATCLQQQNDREQKTMNETPSAPSQSLLQSAAKRTRTLDWERLGFLYARIALGAAFLSGIADRFGLYWGRNVGYGNFDGFMQYTAKVNSFMPPVTIPFLAWAATAGELFFGIALILGIWP